MSELMPISGKAGNIVVAITKIAGYTQEDNNYMLTINNNKHQGTKIRMSTSATTSVMMMHQRQH